MLTPNFFNALLFIMGNNYETFFSIRKCIILREDMVSLNGMFITINHSVVALKVRFVGFQQYFSFISGGKRSTSGENHRPAAGQLKFASHNAASSTPRREQDSKSQLQWR